MDSARSCRTPSSSVVSDARCTACQSLSLNEWPDTASTPRRVRKRGLLRRRKCDRLSFFRHGRRVPLPRQSIALRCIEPHGEVERAFRRGQPVRFPVGTWAFVPEIEIERTVRIVLERHPTADSEAVEAVRDLIALLVAERD